MNTTPSSTPHFTSMTAPGQQVDAKGQPPRDNGGERALVLGGGGSAGNAWEIGVIAGLCDAGLDVTDADLIIGTSAGSTAAAQVTSATRPAELLAAILATAPRPASGPPASGPPASGQPASGPGGSGGGRGPAGSGGGRGLGGPATDHMEKTSAIIRAAEDAADMRRKMGAAALEMDAASGGSGQAQRRAAVAARLPSQHWPQRPMLIVAVDAHTGEPVVFDRHSGVELADAVTASCAGPGVPPHSIDGSRYIDGGYRSNENADLAAGYERVLVLSPLGGRSRAPLDWGIHLAAQAGELRARGSRVETIFPDSSSLDAFGVNLMDPSTRPPAARAGYSQGRALAGQLTGFWR
ncbi:MAG TPA: patatin-like phospholipase family protein [Streptosporangiaceae bacterium]